MTPSFSPAAIASTPPLRVPVDLLPWLRKDRRQAIEGSTFYNSETKQETHDRMGLTYAQRELRRIEGDLKDALRANGETPNGRTAILSIQVTQQRAAVQFWEGKLALLERTIGELEGRQ